jgi:hypothetical protein
VGGLCADWGVALGAEGKAWRRIDSRYAIRISCHVKYMRSIGPS